MNKDILIIGEQRCGKTSVTNGILSKHNNYEPLRGDALEIALSSTISSRDMKERKPKKEDSIREVIIPILSSKEIADYFYSIYNELKIDLKSLNKSIIIDTHSLEIQDAVEYFGADCDIYCLGMPNETAENIKLMIRKNDTINDWTYYTGNTILELACDQIVRNSKTNKEQCKRYNIKFFDTSGDRREKVKEIIKEIENNSINKD